MFTGGLRDTVSVERLAVTTGNKRSMTDLGVSHKCKILPLDSSTTTNLNITIGQGYEIYFQVGTDIKISDKLTVQDGDVYNVQGLQKYKNAGTASHLRVIAEMA